MDNILRFPANNTTTSILLNFIHLISSPIGQVHFCSQGQIDGGGGGVW